MPMDFTEPHCPKCRTKPTHGQRKVTEIERDKLTGSAFTAVSERFDKAFVCKFCGAIYAHSDGLSTFLTRLKG